MKHKKCGGSIVMDLTGLYIINSPSISITPKGISPGMIQIDSCVNKSHAKLICNKCNQVLSTKEDFEEEIIESCGVCGNEYDPSQIHVTDYISKICNECLNSKSTKTRTSNPQRNLLSLYGEIIQKGENPTLLTILLKKI